MPFFDFYLDTVSDDTEDTPGGRLSLARDCARISHREMARATGIRAQTLVMWENDRAAPDMVHLLRLARFLLVSPMWLMSGMGEGPLQRDEADWLLILKQELLRLRVTERLDKHTVKAIAKRIEQLEKRIALGD